MSKQESIERAEKAVKLIERYCPGEGFEIYVQYSGEGPLSDITPIHVIRRIREKFGDTVEVIIVRGHISTADDKGKSVFESEFVRQMKKALFFPKGFMVYIRRRDSNEGKESGLCIGG